MSSADRSRSAGKNALAALVERAAVPSRIGFLAAMLALAAACRGLGETEERELAAARQASYAGRWQEAAVLWDEILLQGDERSREAWPEAGGGRLGLGDPQGAQGFAELGLRTFPDDARLHELRGSALAARSLPRAAADAYAPMPAPHTPRAG